MPTRKRLKKNQKNLPIQVDQSIRKSRPAGTTFLSLNYQKNRSEENKDKLYSHIISYYTLNGFRWNNKPTTLPELAQILKIPTHVIMDSISKVSLNLGTLVDPDRINETMKSIITLSTSWSIQDRGIIQSQVENLLRSQGSEYRPFISGEVNKSLKLLLESNKNLMESFSTFFKSSNTNILNIFNDSNNQDQDSFISPQDALNLIQSNKPKQLPPQMGLEDQENKDQLTGILDSDTLKSIYQDNAIGDLKSVLEGRTGTEALMPIPVPSLMASELTDSLEALQPEDKHSAFSSRRGDAAYDDEEVPNRADE